MSRVSLTRQILHKDFKYTWWDHNLSQDLLVTGRDAMCKRLTDIRAELPLQYKVIRDYAGACKIVRISYLV